MREEEEEKGARARERERERTPPEETCLTTRTLISRKIVLNLEQRFYFLKYSGI